MIEHSKNIPKTLYKYGGWDNSYQKRILTDSEIYFASANQFNDPFGATLPFIYRKSELTDENILSKLIATSANQHLSHGELADESKEKMKATDYRSEKFWNEAHDRLKEYLINTFGIFSMTKNKTDILMWSHYANSHKGFCVGINKSALSLINFTQLKSIDYSNSFPKRPMFVKHEDSNKYLLKLVATKSKHWEYEDEIRFISFKPRSVVVMPTDFIQEIIFGASMSDEHKKEITDLRNKKYPTAKIFQAELDRNKFKINLKALTNH